MVLYDVILVGFPEGPKIGDSEAEALSTVFGIPSVVAERMVAQVPAIVKSGVTEEVCRKYFNAFVYMGAKCDFLLTGEFANSAELDLTSEPSGGSLRLASTEVLAVAPPAAESDGLVLPTEQPDDSGAPEVSTEEDSRTDNAPDDQVAASGEATDSDATRRTEELIPVSGDTSKSLPNQLLRSFLQDAAETTDLGENAPKPTSETSPSLVRPSNSESGPAGEFDLALSAEMTPPEISGWSAKGLDLPGAEEGSKPAGPTDSGEAPAPKASIVDDDPAIGGNRDARRSPPSPLDAQDWRPASDSAPADFLARAATTGESAVADVRIPRETTGIPAPAESTGSGEGSGDTGPSVAEIRAAWQAGNDIPLVVDPDGDAPSLGGWDPWLDSELPDADFPSGVAVNESQGASAMEAGPVDAADGTQLEPPPTARLMAQLDAQRRARELLAEGAIPPKTSPSMDAPGTGDAPAADSNAPLFGAPLGARASSQSGSAMPIRPATENASVASDPKVQRPEPTEVPMAAMNFVRLRKKPRGES